MWKLHSCAVSPITASCYRVCAVLFKVRYRASSRSIGCHNVFSRAALVSAVYEDIRHIIRIITRMVKLAAILSCHWLYSYMLQVGF